ncbi:MAG: methylmalonyl-CoA epimerase [Anaerolineae bacterium]
MIDKIEHIGIAVLDLEAALAFYRDTLGLQTEIEEVPSQQVRVAVMPVGTTRIELLQSTTPEGPIARFIDKRGEGIHHLCLEVDDIQQAMATLQAAGAQLIDSQPRLGAGGRRVAFVHPRSAHGVLIELSERPLQA